MQEAGGFLALCLRRKVFYSAGCSPAGRVVNGKVEIRHYSFGGGAALRPKLYLGIEYIWHKMVIINSKYHEGGIGDAGED